MNQPEQINALISKEHKSLNDYYNHMAITYDASVANTLKMFISWCESYNKNTSSMIVNVLDAVGVEHFLEHANRASKASCGEKKAWFISQQDTSKFFFERRDIFNDWAKALAMKSNKGNYLDWLSEELEMFGSKFSGDDVAGFLFADNRGVKGFKTFADDISRMAAIRVVANYIVFIEAHQRSKL
ncbi:MAG: hypothetical protein J6N72_09430 [Psychrobacter sp.]|nr:hypothetical protein [Psychrobacter sp.]